jgi:microcystin-dependent protein
VPLESATYVTDLVASNPASSDPLSNADDHIRLIKATIRATFPNFTSAALQSTQAQIDAATLAVDTNGVSILADAGVNFKTNTTDGITNPAAGEIDIKLAGNIAARFVYASSITTLTLNGNLTATGTAGASGGLVGPGACPIGAVLIWPSDTLPSGFGVWGWCNGAAYSRTTYAACWQALGSPNTGDGSTTFNVPNYQEVTLVGKSTMGGATSPGLLNSIASGIKAVLGQLFGTDTTTLITANLPPYTPSGSVSSSGSTNAQYPTSTSYTNTGGAFAPGYNFTQATVNVSSSFSGSAQGGTSTPFGNLPPSRTTNFIIRLA